MKPLVLYHDHCTDGYGAAYAAWCSFGDDADYVGVAYGKDFDAKVCIGRDVYILDFSFSRNVMDLIILCCAKFVWLDHHKSAFEMWCDDGELALHSASYNGVHIELDNAKSGALLAWEYFHPDVDVPYMIAMIDDRDRWQFKIAASKAFHAGMAASKPWSFQQWNDIDENYSVMGRILDIGTALLSHIDHEVKWAEKQSRTCGIPVDPIMGGPLLLPGLAVNCTANTSEVGHALANKSGTYGMVWYVDQGNKVKVSLRSNGDYDVSTIAKQYGGGGHKNAAGCEISLQKLMEIIA